MLDFSWHIMAYLSKSYDISIVKCLLLLTMEGYTLQRLQIVPMLPKFANIIFKPNWPITLYLFNFSYFLSTLYAHVHNVVLLIKLPIVLYKKLAVYFAIAISQFEFTVTHLRRGNFPHVFLISHDEHTNQYTDEDLFHKL